MIAEATIREALGMGPTTVLELIAQNGICFQRDYGGRESGGVFFPSVDETRDITTAVIQALIEHTPSPTLHCLLKDVLREAGRDLPVSG